MKNLCIKRIEADDKYNRNIFEMLKSMPKDENGFQNPGYGISWNEYPDFIDKSLRQISNPEIEKGRVPQTLFWLFEDDYPIGISKVRHCLTEELMKRGGHIGYSIVDGKRNRGYGKELLRKTLEEIRKIGVNKVLITCDANNIGSRKVIECNNGILEKEMDNECRYWIEIQ